MISLRFLIAGLALAVLPVGAVAKEKASFIEGTYASEAGCQKLAAIDAGGPRNVETVPQVLTAEGFKSWEGGCEFTKIFEHDPGWSWLGLMVCTEGATVGSQSVVIIKGDGDRFEVAEEDDDEPEVYQRCESDKGKSKP